MFVLTHLAGFGASESAAATPVLTYTDGDYSGTGLTTYTFSSQSLGTESSTRRMIVAFYGLAGAGRTISSVTIAGVSASSAHVNGSGGQGIAAVYIASVPTGTTGDVVITFSGAMIACGFGLWSATDLNSATATDTLSSSDVDPLTGTIDVSADGVLVAVAGVNAAATFAWTGPTERADFGGGAGVSVASDSYVAAQSGLTVTANQSTGTSFARLAAAAFR